MKNIPFFISFLLAIACSKTETPQPGSTKSSNKDIVMFELAALSPKITGTIDNAQQTITLLTPFGIDLSQMKPTISISDKATISPASGDVVDLTKIVVYTVTAEDGSTKAYNVVAQPETRLLFYNANKGTALVTDNKTLSTVSNSTLTTNWSEIVGIGLTQTLFYDSKTGKVTVTDNKTFTKINDYTIETDLYSATYLGSNTLVFLGKSNNAQYFKDLTLKKLQTFPNIGGESVLSNPLGTTKTTYLFYAPTTGLAILLDIKTMNPTATDVNLGKSWTHLLDVGNGNLLAYNLVSGAASLLQNEKPFSKNKDISLAAGYTHLLNAGSGQVLFYNAKTGEGMMTDNKNFTKLSVALPTPSADKWTHVLAL